MSNAKVRSFHFLTLLTACTLLLFAPNTHAEDLNLNDLAIRAVSEDASVAKPAIAELRADGPAGLAVLLAANADAIDRHRAGYSAASSDQIPWPRLAAAIDAVAAQKDAWASGLYWYTDLHEAERAARASGKPILSLRMLGTLDSEYSCANSRYFRTVLYSNAEVSKYLSENFILHWKSVRPVPKVTIDFGDGRVVQRTITGNSIHYVLDADGRVIDGIPGLYGPKAFLKLLQDACDQASASSGGSTGNLTTWHAARMDQILIQWEADLRKCGAVAAPNPTGDSPYSVTFDFWGNVADLEGGPPSAREAALAAVSKGRVEKPLVRMFTSPDASLSTKDNGIITLAADGNVFIDGRPFSLVQSADTPRFGTDRPINPGARPAPTAPSPKTASSAVVFSAKSLETATTDAIWDKIAELHSADSTLDQRSQVLMLSKHPDALQAGRRAIAKTAVENPLVKIVQNFERSIALDTVRNEYTFHRQIHAWLAAGKLPNGKSATDVDALNERVYADLFLTPSSDPWLGLLPADTYSALPEDGLCVAPAK